MSIKVKEYTIEKETIPKILITLFVNNRDTTKTIKIIAIYIFKSKIKCLHSC